MLCDGVYGQRALRHPLERHRRRLGVTLEVGAQNLNAVVNMVPSDVVYIALGVKHGSAVAFGVKGAADGAEAVEVVEDDEADHVVVFVFGEGHVFGGLEEVTCFFFVEADVISIYWEETLV